MAARILAEQGAKSLKWTDTELVPVGHGQDGQLAALAAHTARNSKKSSPASSASSKTLAITGGEAASQAYYMNQRKHKQNTDMQGGSGMKMAELKKRMASSKAKYDEKTLGSLILDTGTHLSCDLRSMMILQHTQTVSHSYLL